MKFTPIYVFYSLHIYTINISRELYKINQIKRHKAHLPTTESYPSLYEINRTTNSIPTAASAKQALR